MAVGSGELMHRMTIYAPEGTYGVGDPAPAANVATGVPAKITAAALQFQQQERLAAGGLSRETLYNIELRYRGDIDAQFQLVEECHTQRRFHIVAMIPSGKMDWMEITAKVAN